MWERRHLHDGLTKVIESAGYRRIQMPLFEETRLFMEKSGVEIIENLYAFKDKGGRNICLRPEATASVARFYIQELRNRPKPLRIYYHGSMYRYERPQKNRYREFFQTGVELIGSDSSLADAEVIWLACRCMESFGLKYILRLNHLGVLKSLLQELNLNEAEAVEVVSLMDRGLLDELEEKVSSKEFHKLRKLRGGRSVLEKAAKIIKEFDKPLEKLDELKNLCGILEGLVEYEIDFGVARGLDYYTGIVFDIKVEDLGAQDQVCGGGRYDNLIQLFGGPQTPAVGFAFGFDRMMEALRQGEFEFGYVKNDIIVVGVGDTRIEAFKTASILRESLDAVVELEILDRSLSKTLSHASAQKTRFAVIVGEKELAESCVTVKDLKTEKQESAGLVDIVGWFEGRM
jgi:histidyl-tRNA synthetase